MRRLHLAAGLVTAAAFLSSGAYMRFFVDPATLAPGIDLLYISRHIYMLAAALVHLVLAAYVRPTARPAASRLQWTGAALLIVSSTLLISAFVFETIGGRGRTAVSAFGIFTLAAGVILHVSAGRLGRER